MAMHTCVYTTQSETFRSLVISVVAIIVMDILNFDVEFILTLENFFIFLELRNSIFANV